MTQLYYKISRIDWDYEAKPAQIKGSECPPPTSPFTLPYFQPPPPCFQPPLTPCSSLRPPPKVHYGPDIAQPIDIDGSRHSRCFISDYLWSLVPTAW